jgi:hypothetical protein
MTRESTLARGRAFLPPALVDTCTVERVASEVNNASTGETVKTYTVIYSGPCRVKMGAAQATRRVRTVGEAALRIASAELQLPVVGSEGILADDRVTVTACVHDTELVGLVFFIVGEHHGTWNTTRRLAMSEVLA